MVRWHDLVSAPAFAAGGPPVFRRPGTPFALMFDRSNWHPEREEDEPTRPVPKPGQERVLMALVFALLALALVLPVSAGALIDLIRYLRG